MHFVSLLMNSDFINSPYKEFDLKLLQSVSNKAIFMDLYRLMTNKTSLKNKHHKKDAVIISQCNIEGVRDLLLEKACNEYSLNSINHEFDMDFISRLHLDSIAEKIYFEIYYYLFKQKGIDDPEHKEKLEKLLQGKLVERNSNLYSYLDDKSSQIIKSTPTLNFKAKTKILNLLKKYK